MEGVTVLRQLVGQIRELWELYGHDHQPHLNNPRWFVLGRGDKSAEDGRCSILMDGKSNFLKMVEPSKPSPLKRSRREKKMKSLSLKSTDMMEQKIWKEIPEDILESVIARLPVATLFRFRTVCRNWNSLLSSSSFSQCFAEVPQGHPWLFTVTHDNSSAGAMYDPSLRKWHKQSISFLTAGTLVLPVASAGGLICFLDIGHTNFYVCNPLISSFKELPPRSVQVWSRVAVGMALNGKTASSGYKIIWLQSNGEHEIFDSVQNMWIRHGPLPPSIKIPLSLNFKSQMVSISSTLYFMRAEPDGILSYDMSNGTWKQLLVPLPLNLTDHTLAEYAGQLMLVGLLSKNAATCICVWELQRMTLLWKEVDRMPNVWCLEFYGKHVRMTCLSNFGLLMLSLRSRCMNRLVTYDIATKEWKRIPDCMIPNSRKKQWIACGTSFHPCPTASA